jgi:Tfp pilus assembly protein PilW
MIELIATVLISLFVLIFGLGVAFLGFRKSMKGKW